MLDLKLNLKSNSLLRSLQIVSDFPEYNELLQRAVVLLLLGNEKTYWIDGEPLYTALEKSNATGVDTLADAISGMGRYLKTQLEADSDVSLDKVDVNLTTVDRKQVVTVNLVLADGSSIYGEVLL